LAFQIENELLSLQKDNEFACANGTTWNDLAINFDPRDVADEDCSRINQSCEEHIELLQRDKTDPCR
jgi:hypothetical protein